MKGTLIYADPNSFEVSVKHNPKDGFLPSEETIAIEKYAQLIREQLQKFLKQQHEPKIKILLQMIDAYNYKNNPEYKQQIDAKKAKEIFTETSTEEPKKNDDDK